VEPLRKRTLENKNEHSDKKNMLQRVDTVIFLKSLRLGYFGYVERMQSQRMPEEIATATVEGGRKGENHVKERGTSLKMT